MTDKLSSRRWKMAINIFTLLALVGLAYAVRKQLADTYDNFGQVNLWYVMLIIPAQVLSYFAQAKLYQGLFRAVGDRFRTKSMLRLALELNFVNTVFPSGGVSGFSYINIRLREEKVSAAKATLVQMLRFVMIFIAVQIMLAVGLIALSVGGRANDFAILIAGVVGTLIAVLTFIMAFVIGSKSRINSFFVFITRVVNGVIHIFRPGHPETINVSRAKRAFTELHETFVQLQRNMSMLKRPLAWALLTIAAEVLTIYVVYVAFGQWVNIGAVILAYAVANFAGLISILPGGIGIYEALMTAVLAAGGISAVVSLPVTVMYRIVSMLVQLIPGYFFYHRTLHAQPSIEDRIKRDEDG